MKGKSPSLVFLVVLGMYLITAPGHIWNTDGWTRYIVAESLVEYGKPIIAEQYIGVLGDFWTVKGVDGYHYSYYGIGQSLVLVPLYMLGRWIGVTVGDLGAASTGQLFASFLNTFVGAFLAVAVFHLARNLGYGKKTAWGVTMLVGFGTIVWQHSRDNYDQLLETLWVTSAYAVLIVALAHKSTLGVVSAGLLAAAGLMTRVSTALAFPGFALLLVFGVHDFRSRTRVWHWRWEKLRNGLWFTAGVLPGILFISWYNFIRFGAWFVTGYEQKPPIWLGNRIWPGMAGFLVSPGRGLLPYVPLIFALPFLFRPFWRRSPVFAAAVTVTSGMYLLVYSQFGGLGLWAWGPHYLLPIIPLLVLPWGEAIESWKLLSRRRRRIMLALVGVSLLVQFASVSALYLRTYIGAVAAGVRVDSTFDWRVAWSPLFRQGENVLHAVQNMMSGREFGPVTSVQADHQHVLDHELSLNVLDWWWVLAMYRGVRWAWVVPLAVVLGIARALPKILRDVE